MSSPSGTKPPSASVEMVPLGKKTAPTSSGAGPGTSKTSFSSLGMKLDSKSLQVNTNQNGHKTSLRTTADSMKMKTGNDQVSFDFSKGQLSIKTGDTHFTLGRGKDGLNMAATDLKSKTKSTFDVSGGKVTKTLEGPKTFKKSISENPHLGALASKHAERIGQMKSPFTAFGSGPFGGGGKPGADTKLGFAAFKRETRSSDGEGTRTTTQHGLFSETSKTTGKGKKRQTQHQAFGMAQSTTTETGVDGELTTMQQRRAAFYSSTSKGRKN